MKGNHKSVSRVLLGLLAGGTGVLFMLPKLLSLALPPNQGAAAVPSSQTSNLNANEPSVQELLETTYLGHAEEYPDPGEPAVVLKKYVERNTHKYLKGENEQRQELDREIAEWEMLVRDHPHSRHALARLAELYRNKAELTQDKSWSRKAADLYIQAAEIGLSHGRIRYTRELSELLVDLNDKAGLDEIFEPILAQPKDVDRGHYYQALVDYGDGLARLNDDQRAWGYFEDAIDFHPEQNIEAINRYTRHLLDRGQAQQALDVLENRLTSEARTIYVMPAHLRKEAMEILGLDTTSAEAETTMVRQRVIENGGSMGVILPDEQADGKLGLQGLLGMLFTPAAEAFVHSDTSDDCRAKDYHTVFCDPYGNCFYPFLVNMAELIDNEAKTETPGARYTVGWAVKGRSFEALNPTSCGAYFGGNNPCTTLCNHPNYCVESREVCCAVHGGATAVGQSQNQWNDGHVPFNTLVLRGTVYAAWYVLDGLVPDPSTGWIPPNVSNCSFTCGFVNNQMQPSGGPWCSTGSNFFTSDPNGPMEFLNHAYSAAKPECKWPSEFVCANGTAAGGAADNYFWNRKGPSLAAPIGYFDGIDNNYFAWGWALDPDTSIAPIAIHIYIDGPAGGGGTFVAGFPANQLRADVNQATGYPGNHGWSWVIPSQYRTAPHTYYVYALDQTGTYNPQLSLSPRTK